MPFDNQPLTDEVDGLITAFMRRNLFKVRLDDGQEIVAVMPERLFSVTRDVPKGWFVRVKVLLQKYPKTSRIVDARLSCLCGA